MVELMLATLVAGAAPMTNGTKLDLAPLRVRVYADPDGRVLVLDPASGWQLAPGPDRPELTAPDELPGRREAPVVSTGSAVLLWGGGVASEEGGGVWGCCRPVGEGEVFTPPLHAG